MTPNSIWPQNYTCDLAFKILDTTRTVGIVEDCVEEIRSWMIAHKLMMNQEKTVIIQLNRQNDDVFTGTSSISGANIPVTPVARNLGVLWDSRLSMKAHVKQTCRASYIHISNIRMLTNEAAETLAHAFVSSRLDYCNSLLYGLPASTLYKLQLIQNHAARIMTAWGTEVRQNNTSAP